MARILAIEPDPERGTRLGRLVRDRLGIDIVLATSADAAIAAMAEHPPDLILTSSLLTPGDDQRLAAHLRGDPALRHLPVLTVPPLVDEPPDTRADGLVSRLIHRRQRRSWPAYDSSALATRIKEAIEESMAAERDRLAASPPGTIEATTPLLRLTGDQLCASCGLGRRQKRARRLSSAEVRWISSVKLPWGLELRLLNISSSGILVESAVRLTPGNRLTFQLAGLRRNVLVSARVVRSRLSTSDPLGARYVAAGQFDQSLDEVTPDDEAIDVPAEPTEHLRELVARIKEDAKSGADPTDLRTVFEKGVRELVTVRDIRLRHAPLVQNDGRDSVYFTIPTHDQSEAVLQATFEPNYQPRPEEFAALRKASVAAADVVQYTDLAPRFSLMPA